MINPVVRMVYKNHDGLVQVRTVQVLGQWRGLSPHHPGEPEQWFVRAFCADGKAERDFAVKNVVAVLGFAVPE
jgi:hypothetical protein